VVTKINYKKNLFQHYSALTTVYESLILTPVFGPCPSY